MIGTELMVTGPSRQILDELFVLVGINKQLNCCINFSSASLLCSLIRDAAWEPVSLLTNLLSLMFAVSICVPIIAPAEASASWITAAMLLNVNVPSTGKEKPVIFPTAQTIVGHLREGTVTSMILRRVCAPQAGKVSLLINMEKLLLKGCLFCRWFLEAFETVLPDKY